LVAKLVGEVNVLVPRLIPSMYKVIELPLITKSQICMVLIPDTAKEERLDGLPIFNPVEEVK
jgi:hypothetical protein